jgi:hypothetical protein
MVNEGLRFSIGRKRSDTGAIPALTLKYGSDGVV